MAKTKRGVKKALKTKTFKLGGKRERRKYVRKKPDLSVDERFWDKASKKSLFERGAQIHQQILGDAPIAAPSNDITITIHKDRAQRISYALDDLLCWATGFQSAFRMDNSNELLGPFNEGVRGVRDIQDLIKYKLDLVKYKS